MQWGKILLAMLFGLSMLYANAESQTGTVDGDNPDAVVRFNNKTDTSYSMYAATGGSWVFTEDFDWSGPNGWYSDAKYTISCERIPLALTAFVDASLCFGASMNGKMYIPGGEGGSPIPWSVSTAYHTAPSPYIWPTEAILPVGEGKSFRYGYDNVFNTNPGGFWKYSGTDVNGNSVQITWQNIGATYNLPTTLEAGQYMLTAARNTQGAFSANANATIVKVEAMEAASDSADGYSTDYYVDIIYVPRNEPVDLVAIPAPGNQWPANEPEWNDGTVDDWNVFQEESPGHYIVDVSCGTSSVEMDIDVVGVASITGTSRDISVSSTIDDTANLTANQTMYLYKGKGKIDFTATKDPADSEWPTGYPKWKKGNTEVGTGETYTFNAPSTTGEHIITAHCGDGYYKAIKIVVFELKATDMAFNYDRTSSGSDGMNLRESNSGAEITAPEATESGGKKKVLYKKDMSVTIKTRFEMTPAGATPSMKVKAVVSGDIEGLDEKTVTIKDTGISDGDTIASKAGFVAFSSTKKTANNIKKETCSFRWKLTEINGEKLSEAIDLNSISSVTVYTISDMSQSPWTPNGTGNTQPWVSALEFAINTGGADGKNGPAALAAITSYLHTGHGMTYDAAGGGRAHFASGASASSFNLTGYISKTANIVNCYDQAAAVVVLGRLLGIGIDYRFMMPFGYINTTNLVGVGNCNNPFYPTLSAPYNIKIVGNDNVFPSRTGFGNHAFASYAGMVYDACAGPVTGSQAEAVYVAATIDRSTPAEAAAAGTTSNISTETIGTIN